MPALQSAGRDARVPTGAASAGRDARAPRANPNLSPASIVYETLLPTRNCAVDQIPGRWSEVS